MESMIWTACSGVRSNQLPTFFFFFLKRACGDIDGLDVRLLLAESEE
jgi:hypothetical protein